MAITRISFQSVPVTDQDRALAFYRDVMGFEVQVDAPYEPDWRWIFLRIPGSGDRIQFAKATEIEVKGRPVLALVSDDVDAEAVRLTSLGATVTDLPQDAPWQPGVRWMLLRDSEGNGIFVESLAHG